MSVSVIPQTHVTTTARNSAFNDLVSQAAEEFVNSLTPSARQAFNGRLERGLQLAMSHAVTSRPLPNHQHRYLVRSSDGNRAYFVDLEAKTCDCPDSLKGNTCKHRVAAYYFEQACQISAAARAVQARPETRVEQVMQELGFKTVEENHRDSVLLLGSLYRQVLQAADLNGQPLLAAIEELSLEQENCSCVGAWRIWVKSDTSPKLLGIPLDRQGEDELVAIFGKVPVEQLKGKTVELYPQSSTIHFREAK